MNKRILLVDDEESLLEISNLILERAGYEVFTASKVPEAYKLSVEHTPFLCLTDLKLSNSIDGATLAGQIKRTDPYVVCIAVTGDLTSFDKGYLLGIGSFTDILLKPVKMELLLEVVSYAQRKYERWKLY